MVASILQSKARVYSGTYKVRSPPLPARSWLQLSRPGVVLSSSALSMCVCCVLCCVQVHMNVLVPFTDRPPGEIISELSALAAARDIAYDQSHNEQALAWRIIRQPEDWEGLVQEVCSRLDRVSPP